MNNLTISTANTEELTELLKIHDLAFQNTKESELTLNLIRDPSANPIVSMVAKEENKIIGHILFTRIYLENQIECPMMHILAPLAVHPDYQNCGIGRSLINSGIEKLKNLGSTKVFVLGHPTYYPKAGFINDAKSFGFEAPYFIPEEHKDAWMILNLEGELIPNRHQFKLKCADSLNREEYWRE